MYGGNLLALPATGGIRVVYLVLGLILLIAGALIRLLGRMR